MDHGARRWKRQTLALAASCENEGSHTSGESEINRNDFGFNVLHGIVNGQSGNDGTAGAVDVEVNGFGTILAVQIQHDTNNLVGQLIVNLGT